MDTEFFTVDTGKLGVALLRVLLVLVFVSVTVYVALNPQLVSVERLRRWGYFGVFLMALVGSTTVILPIPHLAFTFTMGAVLIPVFAGFCGGLGDALGEIWGYLAGYAVEDLVDRWKVYPIVERWMAQNGELTIFLMGVVPMPLFDLAGIAAGAAAMPIWRFFVVTWVAKTIKAIVFAWAGFYGVPWLARLLGVG